MRTLLLPLGIFATTLIAPAQDTDTVEVKIASLQSLVAAPGKVIPLDVATVRSEASVRLRLVEIAPAGRRVKKGDVVARLDPSTLKPFVEVASLHVANTQEELRAARTSVELAGLKRQRRLSELDVLLLELQAEKESVERDAVLQGNGLGGKVDAQQALKIVSGRIALWALDRKIAELEGNSEVEGAQTKADIAHRMLASRKETLAELQRGIDDCTLRAPIDGHVVVETGLVPGVALDAYGTICSIVDEEGTLGAALEVLEGDLGDVAVGSRAIVHRESESKHTSGTVIAIDPEVRTERETGPYAGVTVRLEASSELRPGMKVVAEIAGKRIDQAIVAPLSAFTDLDTSPTCTLVTADGPKTVSVRLGASDGANVVVLQGLATGDRLRLPKR